MHKRKADYMPFRPGDFASRIDRTAKRNNQTRSEVVRNALDLYFGLEPAIPFAVFLGATENYFGLARAARNSDLLSEERFQGLYKVLMTVEREMHERFGACFGEMRGTMESLEAFEERERAFLEKRARMWASDEWKEGSEEQRRAIEQRFDAENTRPEPPEHIAQWQSMLDTYFRFPDLQAARGYFRPRRAARSSKRSGEKQPRPFPELKHETQSE
jgi:hypothetical protein